jgi:hypothetical protein
MRRRGVVRRGVPLHIPVVHLHDSGKENGEECNEKYDKGENMLVGEVAHTWQPCSTSKDTIVKRLLSQPLFFYSPGILRFS